MHKTELTNCREGSVRAACNSQTAMARHDRSDESLGLGETPTNAAVEAGPALGSGHTIIIIMIITITIPSNSTIQQEASTMVSC